MRKPLIVALALITLFVSGLVFLQTSTASEPESVTDAEPESMEQLFSEALAPRPRHLETARQAKAEGDYMFALNEYKASIENENVSMKEAIAEYTELSLELASRHNENEKHREQKTVIENCLKTLKDAQSHGIKNGILDPETRKLLSDKIEQVCDFGRAAADHHYDKADKLYKSSKGMWWWPNDCEVMQCESLHSLNLTWNYLSVFRDEEREKKMHALWNELKDELSNADYERVMQQGRILLGKVIDDTQQQ